MVGLLLLGSSPEANLPMGEDLERLKQRLPLLDYLRQQNWNGRPTGHAPEFVGFCPLHPETRPSFYVNADKNLFYCHGCGKGGDLIRLVQLSRRLSFRESLAFLEQQDAARVTSAAALEETVAFYQRQLPRYPEALRYLEERGLYDTALLLELRLGYAPGGILRRHLAAKGYSHDLLHHLGLVDARDRDAFFQRIVFPCCQEGRLVNLYGRSLGPAFPHRFLPGSRGGLFAWKAVRIFSLAILVEGLFDLASLWQAGIRNTTCACGTHLTPTQLHQLSDSPNRWVYLAFDQDRNQAGQHAAQALAHRLQRMGLVVARVRLPDGHDPNSYFRAGATPADCSRLIQEARSL